MKATKIKSKPKSQIQKYGKPSAKEGKNVQIISADYEQIHTLSAVLELSDEAGRTQIL